MDKQVIIYLDDPTGQLMQVSYSEYKHYWRLIGWRIYDEAPELPGLKTEKKLQSTLF